MQKYIILFFAISVFSNCNERKKAIHSPAEQIKVLSYTFEKFYSNDDDASYCRIVYPVIEGKNHLITNAINFEIKNDIIDLINENGSVLFDANTPFDSNLLSLAEFILKEPLGQRFEISFDTLFQNRKIISIQFDQSIAFEPERSFGKTKYTTINLITGGKVSLNEIFPDVNLLIPILTKSYLLSDTNAQLTEEGFIQTAIGEIIDSDYLLGGEYSITSNGISFFYNTSTGLHGGADPIYFDLPWNDIKNLVSKEQWLY